MIKELAKKIFPILPKWLRKSLYGLYEEHYTNICRRSDRSPELRIQTKKSKPKKPRILFYHVSGLNFGGTEKFLQILAKHINKNGYEVSFMYAPQMGEGRMEYLSNAHVQLVPFSFKERSTVYPFYIRDMKPTLRQIVDQKEINLIITAGSGYAEHPFNVIGNTPIIMLNIFGSPSAKKNIVKHVSISHEVEEKILPIVPKEKCEVMYIPSDSPPLNAPEKGRKLRESLGLSEENMVFGRIGRADDGIFDPIGIRAFQKTVKNHPGAHYLIMSPPTILVKIVEKENIPNVHFLPPSSNEEDIWAFHYAIDVLAHFRNDGESCGLNIIESMIAGNPIITHRSHIWNAHLEYLDESFSRVADKDNIDQYEGFMEEFIKLKSDVKLLFMKDEAKEKGKMFLIENNIDRFERWIDESIVE